MKSVDYLPVRYFAKCALVSKETLRSTSTGFEHALFWMDNDANAR